MKANRNYLTECILYALRSGQFHLVANARAQETS